MNLFRRFWNWLFPLKLVEVSPADIQERRSFESVRHEPSLVSNREKDREIVEKNRMRQRATLGYGLKSRDFKPRSGFEKRQWDISKKPDDD